MNTPLFYPYSKTIFTMPEHLTYRPKQSSIAHILLPLIILSTLVTLQPSQGYAGQEIWSTDFPLKLNDGTSLPEPFAKNAQLEERMERLRQHYAPFTRNLTPKAVYTRPEIVLSAEADWLFREDPNARGEMDKWFAMKVPKDGWLQQALPDYREFILGWYRTTFDAPSWSADRIILHFDAVDYAARVYLNERYIGEHTGYFAPFEFDVTDLLKPTGNVLAVRVDNPVCFQGYRKDSLHGEGMGTVAFNKEQGVVQFSNAAGIYQPVKLVGCSNIYISGLKITPVWPATAKVEARIINLTESSSDLDVTVSVTPRNFEGQETKISKPLSVSKENLQIYLCELNNPKYWTPDETYLYTARVVIRDSQGKVLDCVDESFGMRWLSEKKDGTIMLNKQPYFLRGSGAFGTFWQASVQHDANSIIKDLLILKAAHVDITRPHLHVLPKYFFQYADMYGLMVYFDMPLNGTESFNAANTDITPIHAEEIKRQFRDAVDLFYNHPSIAIWQFINESQVSKPVPQIPPAIKEFVRLSRQIDPTRLVCGASGFTTSFSGTTPNREWWGIGDLHLYPGLITKTCAWADYRPEAPSKTLWFNPEYKKFISETISAFAYPNWQTWRDSFVPWEPPANPKDLYDIRRIPTMEPIFNAGSYLSETMALNLTTRIFGTNVRPLDWIRRTQDHQAYIQKALTDVWRRRPDCTGYIQFNMIDPGPMVFASNLVDGNRRPKKGYFAFAQANAPQRIAIQYEGRRFYSQTDMTAMNIWVYNDYNRPINATLRAVLADKDGTILAQKQWNQVIEGATRTFIDKFQGKLPQIDSGRKEVYLYAILADANGIINYDCLPIEVFATDQPPKAPSIAIYDRMGKTAGILSSAGIDFKPWKPGQSLEKTALLIIGAYSSDNTLTQAKDAINAFVNQGGAVLVLNQINPNEAVPEAFKPGESYAEALRYGVTARMPLDRDANAATCDLSWMPFSISLVPPSWVIQCYYAQNLGQNLLTAGLKRNDLFEWNAGFGYVVEYPIGYWNEDDTFVTCGPWQNQSAVVLKKIGSGKILFSQLILADRYGLDPVATHILNRMFNPDNWKKTPVVVTKSATLDANSTGLNVKLTIENTTSETIAGDIVDQVLQDLKTEEGVAQFVQGIQVKPGETQMVQFTRTLNKPYAGDLPPAVFVFDDGLWSCSNMVSVGWEWNKLEKVRTYDFGTTDSPVADGATKVIPENVFSPGREFGWNEHVFSAGDTQTKDPLMRDYHYYQLRANDLHTIQPSPKVFSVRLPAGQYIFRLMAGDTATGAVAHVSSDTLPPVTIQCDGKQVGRLIRQVPHGTATVTFKHISEQEGVVEISLTPSFKGQAIMISALEVYKAVKK